MDWTAAPEAFRWKENAGFGVTLAKPVNGAAHLNKMRVARCRLVRADGRRICAPPKSRVAEETHSVTSRHVLYWEPPTPECFWMSGSCDGVPHPANDRAKTANSKARKRRIFTSQLVIANEPIMVRSILMSIQVGGKTLGGCRLKRTSLRGLAGPEAGVKG